MAKVLKTPPWSVAQALAIGVVVCILLACGYAIYELVGSAFVTLLVITGLILFSLFPAICTWFFRTLRYEFGPDVWTIVRAWPLSRISIPYGGITSVTRPALEHQYGSIEEGGNPMLTASRSPIVRMAATDSFILVQMGLVDYRIASPRVKVFGAVTDPRNLVLIEGKDNFLLSPERPDEFAECLRKVIENTAQTTD